MADNETNPFLSAFYPASYFFASGPGVNLKLREKIALAQMMQKRAHPKTFGEGLAAIGDALGDRRMAIDLERQDKASQAAAAALGAPPADAAAAPRASYAPSEDEPPIIPAEPSVVRTVTPPPVPPPDGTPGNTGATTFPPPYQPPPPPAPSVLPPAARSAAPPPPAETAPSDFNGRFGAAPPGRQSMMRPPPGTPVMAMGSDPSEDVPPPANSRDMVAMALMRQGVPPPNPTQTAASQPGSPLDAMALAAPDTSSGIRPAPPDPRVQLAQAQAQPDAIAGYVPPERSDPTKAVIVPPSKRERELQLLLNANQGNPYAPQSPAAIELQNLQAARAKQQALEDKRMEAEIARTTKGYELRETGKMTQSERQQESQRREIDLKYQQQKLIDEGLKRQQELVSGGPGQGGPDPYIGTPQSRQRTGVPEPDPVPRGMIPADWAKSQQKKIEQDATNLETAKPELRETLDLMAKVRAHPSKEASLGTLGGLAKLTAGGQGFAALHEQLKGKNLVAAYQKIKGTGPVGEREGENIAKAQAALTTAANQKDYDDALNTLEGTLRGAVERAERKMRQPVTAYQNSPNDPYAPDLNQRGTRTINGRPTEVEYIGGDPSKDSSYRTVRR